FSQMLSPKQQGGDEVIPLLFGRRTALWQVNDLIEVLVAQAGERRILHQASLLQFQRFFGVPSGCELGRSAARIRHDDFPPPKPPPCCLTRCGEKATRAERPSQFKNGMRIEIRLEKNGRKRRNASRRAGRRTSQYLPPQRPFAGD